MTTKRPRLLHLIQGLEFPDYEYQEYPKHITDANGVAMIAHSKDHEKEMKKPPEPKRPTWQDSPSNSKMQLHSQKEQEGQEGQEGQTGMSLHSQADSPTSDDTTSENNLDSRSDNQAMLVQQRRPSGSTPTKTPPVSKVLGASTRFSELTAKPGDYAKARSQAEGFGQSPGGIEPE